MNNDLIERLSDRVHQAWMAEKRAQGFADHPWNVDTGSNCGPSGCGFEYQKHHNDMLSYADLPDNIKEYDRATVRSVMAGIKAEGYAVLRRPQSGVRPWRRCH